MSEINMTSHKLIAYIVVIFSESAPVGMIPSSWFRLKSLKCKACYNYQKKNISK